MVLLLSLLDMGIFIVPDVTGTIAIFSAFTVFGNFPLGNCPGSSCAQINVTDSGHRPNAALFLLNARLIFSSTMNGKFDCLNFSSGVYIIFFWSSFVYITSLLPFSKIQAPLNLLNCKKSVPLFY